MSTSTETVTKVFQVWIRSTPEQIWEAITSRDWSERYGYKCPFEYDLRPGGAYRAYPNAAMKEYGSPDIIIDGEVVESDPPNRLVQTWHAMFEDKVDAEGFTTLTWEIAQVEEGVSRLTLTHDVTNAPYTAAMVSGEHPEAGGGWPMIISDLKTLLETGSSLSG